MSNLSSDIYDISKFINEISSKYNETSDNTLYLGLFGHLGETLSSIMQNSIIMASEYSNESIPSKAKFEKNIITHALNLGYTDINAKPSIMNILLGFNENDIILNMNNDIFTIDSSSPFRIGNFEFHLDYDIILTRSTLNGNNVNYTARYDMSKKNIISDVINPYLTPPTKMTINGNNIIYINCNIRQVSHTSEYSKIISNSSIENKTMSFQYEDQLACFYIEAVETDGNILTLYPIYDGITSKSLDLYFYYSYIDNDNIRIKFDNDSYTPSINTEIYIKIQTTKGMNGNFEYTQDINYTISSETYNYNDISCTIKPITNSQYGYNKKSIDDLKKIIPNESASRGSITNSTDLENFFNMINTDSDKVYFFKRVDNQFERSYFSYIIMKDTNNNIIPTNTLTIQVPVQESEYGVHTISTGERLKLVGDIAYKIDIDEEVESTDYIYTTPFMMVIHKDPLYVSYYMNIINMNRYTEFKYINESSEIQFISTSVNWKREYLSDRDTYKLNIPLVQNITDDVGFILFDEDGNPILDSVKIKVFVVLYMNDSPHRYIEAKLISLDTDIWQYNFEAQMTTEDVINNDNLIRINDVKDIGFDNSSYAYFDSNIQAEIHIVIEGSSTSKNLIQDIVPDITNYTLTNIYNINDGLDFFFSYTDIVSSFVNVDYINDTYIYNISSVPLIRYEYIENEEDISNIVSVLDTRKAYMDYALTILEDSIGIDFKFFNTYGPSKTFYLESGGLLNNVTLNMKFRIKFVNTSDSYLQDYILSDIKDYVEDITEISDLHIPNLITLITTKYRDQIVYFEFLDMNGYGPGEQHIYNESDNILTTVPELLNIGLDRDNNIDIGLVVM